MSKASGFQVSGNAAELYERYAVPYVLGPWAPELVELAALQRGERVLDLACGTGVVARLAAARVGTTGQVIGMDLNAGMIEVARALPAPSGPPIVWVEGSAMAMKLPDASIDVILCQQGLQFFPEKLAALREMHRFWYRADGCSSASGDRRAHTTPPSVTLLNGTWTWRLQRSIAPIGWCRMPRSYTACLSRQASVMYMSGPAL